jgi:hypothetical protein
MMDGLHFIWQLRINQKKFSSMFIKFWEQILTLETKMGFL